MTKEDDLCPIEAAYREGWHDRDRTHGQHGVDDAWKHSDACEALANAKGIEG